MSNKFSWNETDRYRSRKCRIEPLEERALLTAASGSFTRLEGLLGVDEKDLVSVAIADGNARDFAGYVIPSDMNDSDVSSDDMVALTSAQIDLLLQSPINPISLHATSTAHALSEITTSIGGTTNTPVVTQVSTQQTLIQTSLSPDLGPDTAQIAANASTATKLRGDFQYNAPDAGAKRFWSGIYLVGVGNGLAVANGNVLDVNWLHTTCVVDPVTGLVDYGMHIEVWKNYGTLLADIYACGVGSGSDGSRGYSPSSTAWAVTGVMVDESGALQPVEYSGEGLNLFLGFVTNIQDNDVITFTTQAPNDFVRPELGNGILSGQGNAAYVGWPSTAMAMANFAEAVNVYGFAYDAANPTPPTGIFGGDGNGSAPGDLNGDGVIDGADGTLWALLLASWATDSTEPLVVTTEDDVSNGNYSF